ncbi:MAG: hypothetical protein PHN18_05935 [Sulfurospirillaceae bacterium]|nr:hypothetical protein [Sulfurospirillaceae bacterium]MDD2825852.1 hypothetical protein [Sulfurospirillaceae bacterium]
MSYFLWFSEHSLKHRQIIQKLLTQNYNKEAIIEYFKFENMLIHEPEFCLLYKEGKKCHERAYLNCYLCACPYFRFNDAGIREENDLVIKSECMIHSRKASYFVHEKSAHLDCSKCIIPHTKVFVDKHFDSDWMKIMKACVLHR